MATTITPSNKGPRRPQRRVARLDSFSNPQPRPAPRVSKPVPEECPNPDCRQRNTGQHEDTNIICSECGTIIAEVNIVNEVSFGQTSGGQAVLQGQRVSATDAFVRSSDGPGRNQMSSQDLTRAAGKKYIDDIGYVLHMQQSLRDSAIRIFGLALGGFIQGRRIKSVAAVALYIACRLPERGNTHMLIDFADILQIDVFNLGHVYKDLIKHLNLNGNSYIVHPMNPEDLILRFCQNPKLEFGKESMKVAKDAVRIVQRMDRDWMTPGRRPAGICGAALILAARMNNFRRTVREVVIIVKVQEQTIFSRLDEFKMLESSGLTVEEFRSIDLERYADPPVFTQQQDGTDTSKKRGRKRRHEEFDDDGDNDQPTVISSRASSATPANTVGGLNTSANTQRQARIDSERMPPPPLPVDPNLLEVPNQQSSQEESATSQNTTEKSNDAQIESTGSPSGPSTSNSPLDTPNPEPPPKRRRGRPPKNLATPPASQVTDDPALAADITVALTNPTNIDHANALTSALGSISESSSPPPTQQTTSDQPSKPRPPIPDTENISDSEFADDLEVGNCLLTLEEIAIKTKIWTHENRDYLRAQSAKLVKQKLEEENGTARTIVRRKRKRKRMGDMSAYIGEDGEEGQPIAGSPHEATMKMLNRRTFSKKVNYDMLRSLYGDSMSDASSRRTSVAGESPGSGAGATNIAKAISPHKTAEPGEEPEEAISEAGVQDKDGEQEESNASAGEHEAEGTDEDESEDEDEDPFAAGGYGDSD